MTKKGNKGKNNPEDLSKIEYINIPIGQYYIKGDYCWKSNGANCSNNNEFFDEGGVRDCKCASILDRGCRRHKCVRRRYTGDPKECCMTDNKLGHRTGNPSIFRTCDPKYRTLKGSGCDDTMKEYCKTADNLFTDRCKEWYQAKINESSSKADDVILEVCNKPEYIDRPECGCMFAIKEIQTKFPSAASLPVDCVHVKCTNEPRALKTLNQTKTSCDVVNCEVNVSDMKAISSGGGSFNSNFVQKCGQQQPPATTPSTGTDSGTNTTNATAIGVSLTDNNNVYWIVGGIVMLLFLGIIIFAITKK